VVIGLLWVSLRNEQGKTASFFRLMQLISNMLKILKKSWAEISAQ